MPIYIYIYIYTITITITNYNSEDAKKSSFVRVRVYTAQCTLNCISITSDEKKVYISD